MGALPVQLFWPLRLLFRLVLVELTKALIPACTRWKRCAKDGCVFCQCEKEEEEVETEEEIAGATRATADAADAALGAADALRESMMSRGRLVIGDVGLVVTRSGGEKALGCSIEQNATSKPMDGRAGRRSMEGRVSGGAGERQEEVRRGTFFTLEPPRCPFRGESGKGEQKAVMGERGEPPLEPGNFSHGSRELYCGDTLGQSAQLES